MSTLTQRQAITELIEQAVRAGARQARACQVVGISERTVQRWQRSPEQGDRRPERVQRPRNRLEHSEREHILAVVNRRQYAHLPPSQIVPLLADEGIYLASESSIYRLLRQAGQMAHRSGQRQAAHARAQPLVATAPRQLFSWDITYLPAVVRGRFYYLYLFVDLFSRRIVGWQVFNTEDSDRASQLLQDICQRERIAAGQVVLHSDNGGPMKGATMLAKMHELGVAASFSRPAVSNDNPYSESLFGTMKGRPNYPRRPLQTLQQARGWLQRFVRWYNTEHRHSAIGFVTPDERHSERDVLILAKRDELYKAARARHPERWSGNTRNWTRVQRVHLNPAKEDRPQPLATSTSTARAVTSPNTAGVLKRAA